MSIEDGRNKVIVLIDSMEGQRYVELVKEDIELDNTYNLTVGKADYVDLDSDGNLSWQSTSSCDYESD